MEPCSGATKLVAIFLTVKPSKIVRFKNTGVWLFICRVSGVYKSAVSFILTLQIHNMTVDFRLILSPSVVMSICERCNVATYVRDVYGQLQGAIL